ncbi:hypothetical protein T4B_5499 [Trichinella pseudospiralis]|uniref:Uncharacterized protein n=1 Tax=Trichinella pseudospiralis TaxID=6337 RepID=A0A0V1GE10_TRIPS|nr:hypothetical protein T4B_5499 [Trichinella pseudospiralis]
MKVHLHVDLQEICPIGDRKGISAARSNPEMKSLGTLPLRAHPS